MSNLFKKEYLEKKMKEERDKQRKWFVYLVLFYKRINMIVLWLAILINASIIVYMIYNFNVGIIVFILNQYFVLSYYIKVRKERVNK